MGFNQTYYESVQQYLDTRKKEHERDNQLVLEYMEFLMSQNNEKERV